MEGVLNVNLHFTIRCSLVWFRAFLCRPKNRKRIKAKRRSLNSQKKAAICGFFSFQHTKQHSIKNFLIVDFDNQYLQLYSSIRLRILRQSQKRLYLRLSRCISEIAIKHLH